MINLPTILELIIIISGGIMAVNVLFARAVNLDMLSAVCWVMANEERNIFNREILTLVSLTGTLVWRPLPLSKSLFVVLFQSLTL